MLFLLGAKMIALGENRRVFTLLGMCPVNEGNNHSLKYYRFISIATFYVVQVSMLLSSTIFFVKYVSSDLENALYAFFQSVGMFSSIYAMTLGIILNQKIYEIFKNYEQFYGKCEYFGTYI